MLNGKIVISSTSVDTDGDQMTREALLNVASDINSSERKPIINIEHNPFLLPLGCVTNAEVKDKDDGVSLLMVDNHYYNKNVIFKDEVEGVLVKLSFDVCNYPLRILDKGKKDKIEILVDPNSFVNGYNIDQFKKEINQDLNMDFDINSIYRKSEFPNPILIFNILPQFFLLWLGSKLIYKYLEKNVELLAEKNYKDINNFISLVKNTAMKLLKNSKEKEFIFIIESQGSMKIQLLFKTFSIDELLDSLNNLHIKTIEDKIERLVHLFAPEFVQFVFDRKKGWIFNYLVDKQGKTIGTYKAYEKTKYEYKKINAKDIFSSMEFTQLR